MNARKAKQLRQRVYGKLYSPRFRTYKKIGNQIIADARRQAYQALKKEYKNKGGKNGKVCSKQTTVLG